MRKTFLFLFIFLSYCSGAFATYYDFDLVWSSSDSNAHILIEFQNEQGKTAIDFTGEVNVILNSNSFEVTVSEGFAKLDESLIDGSLTLVQIEHEQVSSALSMYYFDEKKGNFKHIPLWLSIIPPLIAIFLALAFKEVYVSLFAGVWFGAFIINGLSITALFTGFFNTIDTYIPAAASDGGHMAVIIFSLLIGAMVAVISKNGGMEGVVNQVSRYAKDARSSQLATWFMGLVIFFDDYANTLVVGNTMRPLLDKYRVSREKLAYIVDSTAAPIAAIAIITTWIGAELGYIQSFIESFALETDPYSIFLNSLKYAYYPFLTIFFMFLLIWKGKDFGPMLHAENKARQEGNESSSAAAHVPELEELNVKEGVNRNALFAVIPILSLVFTVIGVLVYSGSQGTSDADLEGLSSLASLGVLIGNSDSYQALLWGSGAGLLVASIMSIASRKLTLAETTKTMFSGFKTMLNAVVILVLAWSLGGITGILHTGDFISSILPDGINPYWLPMFIFIAAGFISFSTGSSWSTMGILYPICLPIIWVVSINAGLSEQECFTLLFNTTSVVLAGSVLGDHCSPISDTTILSSLASSCNHIEHVRTQLPYALTVGLISILLGGVFFVLRIPWFICYPVGMAMCWAVIHFYAKPVQEPTRMDSQSPD